MATALFHVKVKEVSGTRLVLHLRIITGEQPDFYSGRAFALMLIYDPIVQNEITDAPLAQPVSRDDIVTLSWLHEHVNEYIDDAVLIDIQNLPVQVDLAKMSPKERNKFFASSRAPWAIFEVIVTKPDWLAHLKPRMEWDSSAYDAFL
jgi:hypothetical protein